VTSGLVDIILPTQHRPHTVGYAIQAVIAQTYRCWRLHVVCDGCDERTEAVVRSFGDDRIAFYRFPKAPGFGYAHRNTVLRQTDGEFVAYATDDDLWLSDHLATGIEALRSRELALVAFRSALVAVPDRLDPHFFAYDWRTTAGCLTRSDIGTISCSGLAIASSTIGSAAQDYLPNIVTTSPCSASMRRIGTVTTRHLINRRSRTTLFASRNRRGGTRFERRHSRAAAACGLV
jgi:glycosyltransferase involved in cell wall biosynthesis